MDDRYDPNLILAYVEGELPEDAKLSFERRLLDDAELRELVEGMSADRTALRGLPRHPPPRDLADAAVGQLERATLLMDEPPAVAGRVGSSRSAWWGRAAGYGSLAAALALVGVVIIDNMSNSTLLDRAQRLAMGEATELDTTATAATGSDGPTVALGDHQATERLATTPSRATRDERAPSPAERVAAADVEVLTEAMTPLAAARERGLADVDPAMDVAPAAGRLALAREVETPIAEPTGSAAPTVREPARDGGWAGAADAGRVVAFEPASGDIELVVRSARPAMTRRQVAAWALSNGVEVIEPADAVVVASLDEAEAASVAEASDDHDVRTESRRFADGASARGSSKLAGPAREELLLLTTTAQAQDLLRELNRAPVNQTAMLQTRADAPAANVAFQMRQQLAQVPVLQVSPTQRTADRAGASPESMDGARDEQRFNAETSALAATPASADAASRDGDDAPASPLFSTDGIAAFRSAADAPADLQSQRFQRSDESLAMADRAWYGRGLNNLFDQLVLLPVVIEADGIHAAVPASTAPAAAPLPLMDQP